MVKYYEVVEVLSGGVEIELSHYRGYDLESADYCFEHNNGNLELRVYDFKEKYEMDSENDDYMNSLLVGGLKCGYEILRRKKEF